MSKKKTTGDIVHDSKQKAPGDTKKGTQAVSSLQKNEGLMRTILDILPIGIQLTDKSGIIVQQNPADKKIYAGEGYTEPGNYSECGHRRAAGGEHIAYEDMALTRVILKGETSINEEIEIKCPDGTSRIILNSALPVYDDRRETGGALAICRQG